MDNTATLVPDKLTQFQPGTFPEFPHDSPPDAGQAPVTIPGMSLSESRTDDTEELPRAGSALRREARRRRFPLFQLLAAIAGGAAGAYFALTLPEGADLSESLLCRSGDFAALLLRRLAWGGAFLLAEYICGYFALGWLLVWAAPLICGLGTGAALAGAFTAGENAAFLVLPAVGTALTVALAANTSQHMSAQLLQLVSGSRGVVSDSPAAGEYTLRFLVWCGILAAFALVECALRCLVIS